MSFCPVPCIYSGIRSSLFPHTVLILSFALCGTAGGSWDALLCPIECPTSLNQWGSPCTQESPPPSSPFLSGKDSFFSEKSQPPQMVAMETTDWEELGCPDLPIGPQGKLLGKLLVSRSLTGEEGLCTRAFMG